jgi:hypothetical protein
MSDIPNKPLAIKEAVQHLPFGESRLRKMVAKAPENGLAAGPAPAVIKDGARVYVNPLRLLRTLEAATTGAPSPFYHAPPAPPGVRMHSTAAVRWNDWNEYGQKPDQEARRAALCAKEATQEEVEAAEDWLIEFLSRGEARRQHVLDAAACRGHSNIAIRTAAFEQGINTRAPIWDLPPNEPLATTTDDAEEGTTDV